MSELYEKLDKLSIKRAHIELGGGLEKINRAHSQGKLTARERIDVLLDSGTFVELNTFVGEESAPGEGVITGYGKIGGKYVYLFAQDFTVFGGSLGEMHALKITKLMDLAAQNGAPIIGLNDSGGARIQEGVVSLDGYGHLFYRNVLYSGVVPQISVIMGSCAGGAVYSPALTDFIFMVRGSKMFITGPKVIETVTREKLSAEELGGADLHSRTSGNVHFVADSEEEVLQAVRKLIGYLPSSNKAMPERTMSKNKKNDWREELLDVLPASSSQVYDMLEIITLLVDEDTFLEVHSHFARNVIVGFGRIDGRVIGIAANQPKVMAGCLDIDSADKMSRFIRFCDAFNIPVLTLVDVTGFLPGTSQEHKGIIRHGAKILYAYSEATVPKISLIVRKAFGGAYVALNSKSLGADFVFAWPSAEIAVMGAEGAASIIYGKEINESEDPVKAYKEKVEQYKERFLNPYIAAARGMVDDVIDPRETRVRLISALDVLQNKKIDRPTRKHGNIPL